MFAAASHNRIRGDHRDVFAKGNSDIGLGAI
jgi:hypothetical protein